MNDKEVQQNKGEMEDYYKGEATSIKDSKVKHYDSFVTFCYYNRRRPGGCIWVVICLLH